MFQTRLLAPDERPILARHWGRRRSDRVAKYNQLLRIGWALGEPAVYAGKAPYKRR